MKHTTEEEWRCRKCGTLLGIRRAGRVHVKHKRAQFVVRGHIPDQLKRDFIRFQAKEAQGGPYAPQTPPFHPRAEG